MAFLLASLAVLAIGPVSYKVAAHAPRALKALDLLVVFSVGALVILHILPETVEQGGVVAVLFMVVGLLGPTLVERSLHNVEPYAHGAIIVVVLLGLAVHALLDGLALALPPSEPGLLGSSLPLAVVLHRVPVSLVIWWLLRPRLGVWPAALALSVEGLGTIVGYALAQQLAPHVENPVLNAVQALVAGSLLHVVVDRRDFGRPHVH